MADPIPRRPDASRQRNLSRILRRIHVAPATRSDLTRLTGLNRSTIGTLVADLTERGLAIEDDASSAGQIGRPSPLVRPSDRPVAMTVNPEIDAITVGVVQLGGRVLRKDRIEVSHRPSVAEAVAVTAEAVARISADLAGDHDVVGLGAAVPGIVRMPDGFVRIAPHLGWRDVAFGEQLQAATGLPVQAANDAILGAQAEWIFGAGRGSDDLLYVNGGASGIGGGIVSGGAPLRGASGHAGEIGHVTVRRGGSLDSAGQQGTLESEVHRAGLLRALGLPTASPDEFERILLASKAGAVTSEVHRQIDSLVVALATAVNLLNPSRIVLGGFLGSLAAVDLRRIRDGVAAHSLDPLWDGVDIRRSQLGSDLLTIGAAQLPIEALIAGL
ncbi:putative NBD/HSP70 family sugar kinase [Frondihabitans sp. PhB188]|uniref:ROK family protein n=1 Tax=Frondihabitans sp. PhB188 TaxID=2485200 RepID=UPI000F4A080F|nr:ROK family protein [Frondihabitans sp. PhB188]ROQ41487.1 putative NBD/HSP70 family sugar kinase [Frondihabitans sp. PhB188]